MMTLVFGVMFYDTIGFTFTDEICALLLVCLYAARVATTPSWPTNKGLLITFAVFSFYFAYSLAIQSNTPAAIATDCVIQIKPYLGFFCVYAIAPRFSVRQRRTIRRLAVLFAGYTAVVAALYVSSPETIKYTFGGEARLATAVTIIGLLYLYFSKSSTFNSTVYLAIMVIGLFSGRSKFYGFFTASCLTMVYIHRRRRAFRISAATAVFVTFAFAAVLLVAWDKISFYFATAILGDSQSTIDLYARAALYMFTWPLLIHHIPFGTGFASYATYTSGVYYSPLYSSLGIDNIYGLTRSNPDFLSDTYYPALAQFGFVGILLFASFWFYAAKKAAGALRIGARKEGLVALLVVVFFLIECTSDSTITHNRGVFMMMLLGLVLGDIKRMRSELSSAVVGWPAQVAQH
ncbi:MAG: O-antigen ligase family protein [Deltaproteobacteria bacterium]|nr:O-antigen ligase family protein [Deltaproteobacteria bacterium]